MTNTAPILIVTLLTNVADYQQPSGAWHRMTTVHSEHVIRYTWNERNIAQTNVYLEFRTERPLNLEKEIPAFPRFPPPLPTR